MHYLSSHFQISARKQTNNGREYLIVPGVAIVEGVMNGELVTTSEFGRVVESWNGRPIVIDHPVDDMGMPRSANAPDVSPIGTIFSARVIDDRLVFDYWFDVASLKAQGKAGVAIISNLLSGSKMEQSTAYYRELVVESGTFKGVSYIGRAKNIIPDHVAIFIDETRGACSVNDGCGVPRINTQENDMSITEDEVRQIVDDSNESLWQRLVNWATEREPVANEGQIADLASEDDAGDVTSESVEIVETSDDSVTSEPPDWAQSLIERVDALSGDVAQLRDNMQQETQDEQNEIVGRLAANEYCQLSEDQLRVLSVDALRALERSFSPTVIDGGISNNESSDIEFIEMPLVRSN